ncbi:MAG: hypothetical protein FJY92_05640, partial [Candidatus Hydrogenedentes bacterium]|nr:hypothetical protein [Candidatus Hydrogenedentota bacterium]
MRRNTGLLFSLLSSVAAAVCGAQDNAGAHSPASALQAFRLADDRLVIEAAASEPNVVDPVGVTWDEDGRMYVVEMRDYPDGGGGTVRRLVDADRDGVYETATVFAEGLPFATSAIPWNGGLIVAAAPDLLYLKDTNDDGVADERRALFTGFGQGLPQGQVNGLYWGADLWVYGSNGGANGAVSVPGAAAAPVSIESHDFRFRPVTGAFEAVSGFSQNGSCQTWWGDRLVSRSASPYRLALPGAGVEDVSVLEWFDSGRIWPIAPAQQRFGTDPLDYFNAACGLAVYDGGALDGYDGNAFACEPVSNLVHRRTIAPKGSIVTAMRGESGFDFLASSDPWFRPVGVATGPDGALYIVDFC